MTLIPMLNGITLSKDGATLAIPIADNSGRGIFFMNANTGTVKYGYNHAAANHLFYSTSFHSDN